MKMSLCSAQVRLTPRGQPSRSEHPSTPSKGTMDENIKWWNAKKRGWKGNVREVKRETLSQLISTTTCEPESLLLRRKERNQKKTKTQTKLKPQTLQSKTTTTTTKIPRENNVCIFKRKYPKDWRSIPWCLPENPLLNTFSSGFHCDSDLIYTKFWFNHCLRLLQLKRTLDWY